MKIHTSRRILPYLAFSVLLLVFFHPVAFSGRVLAPLDILDHLYRPWSAAGGGIGVHNAFVTDAVSQYLTYDYSVCKSLKGSGFIGWCPDVYSGCSLFGNTMLCPGDWHHQLYRVLPFWTAWNLGIVIQFAIAGFGMIFLLMSLGISSVPALFGAIAFTFYSQHVTWIYHRWVLGASCWFPWMTWAVRNFVSGEIPRSRRRTTGLAAASILFTALSLRGGHLQSCLFTALVLIALFLESWWRREKRWSVRAVYSAVLPFALVTAGASILSADVMASTIPPFMDGCRDLAPRTWKDTLLHTATYITAFFPTVLGTPQSMDLSRLAGSTLFGTKYSGCLALIFAVIGFKERKAPVFAKILIALGLIVTVTPLLQWFYDRSTVVIAFGAAVLASHALNAALSGDAGGSARRAGVCLRVFAAVCVAWLAASIIITALEPRLIHAVHDYIRVHLPGNKPTRLEYMFGRGCNFVAMCKVWHMQNVSILLCIAAGLIAWKRIGRSGKQVWIISAALFLELYFYSRSWITFSDRPESAALYAETSCITELKRLIDGKGRVTVLSRADGDYFPPNVAIGNDIPIAMGYETIIPKHVIYPEWRKKSRFSAAGCAAVGISHAVCQPELDVGRTMSEWNPVYEDDSMRIYENPLFIGLNQAVLADGSIVPLHDISPAEETSRSVFRPPVGAICVKLLRSFNPHWLWRIGTDDSWHTVEEGENGTIEIKFKTPLEGGEKLEFSFFRFPFFHK